MRLDTPASRRAYTKEIFSTVAPVYPLITSLLSFNRDKAWKQTLLRKLPAREKGVLIDLACGSGDLALACKERFPLSTVIGVDYSAKMLAASGRLCRSTVHLAIQDMHALGIRSRSIDLLTAGYALRNAPDIETAIQEISRVIKPQGVAAFLDFSRSPSAVAAWVHFLLLYVWGSFWGVVLHRNPRVYAYIAESLRRFPDRKTLRRLFEAHGLHVTGSWRRMFGMVELHLVQKTGTGP
ncbi:MAG: class I SAM-dependent methyltransferase [Chitinispirillaceae bacterium]|nr:class I SAM-dependent methyltransferase [Chitinispirillaceae bacterium]